MKDNEIALRHNRNDLNAFNKILNLTNKDKLDGLDKVTLAYSYFSEHIDISKLNFQNILTNMIFVGIDLGVNDDEQQIFDTINSLGVKLSSAELLKNYFFHRDDIQLYIDYWQNVFEKDADTRKYWDNEINVGSYQRSIIDLFLYSFLQIKIQDPLLNVKSDDKLIFSKVEGLFESYKKFIGDYDIDKKELISEIKEYAKVFSENFNIEIVDNELTGNYGIERINAIIFGLENTTLIPYVLYVLKNVTDEKERNGIFAYLESYIMRRMVCHANTKNYNQLFTERFISNHILKVDNIKTFISSRSDKINFMPIDSEVTDGFRQSKLINKQAAGIIYFIETIIRNKHLYSTSLLGLNRYSLEHVMPKKWENNWSPVQYDDKKDKRNRKLLTIGNLTIITSSLNSSIRDGNWDVKRNGKGNNKGLKQYASGLETFTKYLDYPNWDEDVIDERANYLSSKAIEIWSI